jgi:hypothetical protein
MSNDKVNAAYNGINNPDPYDQERDPAAKPKKPRRIFMWFFLAVQALFLIWLVAGVSGNAQESTGLTGTEADAYAVGTGIGVMLIIGLWLAVDFLLVIGWAVVRLARKR